MMICAQAQLVFNGWSLDQLASLIAVPRKVRWKLRTEKELLYTNVQVRKVQGQEAKHRCCAQEQQIGPHLDCSLFYFVPQDSHSQAGSVSLNRCVSNLAVDVRCFKFPIALQCYQETHSCKECGKTSTMNRSVNDHMNAKHEETNWVQTDVFLTWQ